MIDWWSTSRVILAATLALGLAITHGCQRASDTATDEAKSPVPAVTASDVESPEVNIPEVSPPEADLPDIDLPDIDLVVTDIALYNEVVEQYAGKVVLVDFWATWCRPCLEHFPKTVRWGNEYADEGLAVIAVSVDDPGSAEAAAKFLAKQDARFDTLISELGTGLATWEAFDLTGGVPFYKLYDRSGRLRYRFSGNAGVVDVDPIDQIEPRIRELLAEKAEN